MSSIEIPFCIERSRPTTIKAFKKLCQLLDDSDGNGNRVKMTGQEIIESLIKLGISNRKARYILRRCVAVGILKTIPNFDDMRTEFYYIPDS